MGTTSRELPAAGLADALFPRVRQRVLAILFGNPQRSFFLNEVVALAGSGKGAVQRELAALAQAGLLTLTRQGNQAHFRADEASPVFGELRSLVLKTSGLALVLQEVLQPLAASIDAAFVFGSVARHTDTASSDIDLMVLSPTLGYGELLATLEGASARLGRRVNPTVYTFDEFQRRRRARNAFVASAIGDARIWVIGSEGALHERRPAATLRPRQAAEGGAARRR